jgi:hypothetical protein
MKILPLFCLFLLISCPKKTKKDVSVPSNEFPQRLNDYFDDLEEEELDNLPEDTAVDR